MHNTVIIAMHLRFNRDVSVVWTFKNENKWETSFAGAGKYI